ncbi:MAG: hypothetical protein H5T97_09360, partial [Firmicutes bacterium]|nr:hypothetical protein [Bacillota bacterium]
LEVWNDEANTVDYVLGYHNGRNWRLVTLSGSFKASDLNRCGLLVYDKVAQKVLTDYIARFISTNQLLIKTDTTSKDALAVTMAWIRENSKHFVPSEKNTKRIGKFTRVNGTPAIVISAANLQRMLEREGFDWYKVVRGWRQRGWLILTTQNKTEHSWPLDGIAEPCIVLNRTRIDPAFGDNYDAITRGIERRCPEKKDSDSQTQAAKINVVSPVEVNVTLIPLGDDGNADVTGPRLIVKRIVPNKVRQNDSELPADTPIAQMILSNPLSNNDRVVAECNGRKWLIVANETDEKVSESELEAQLVAVNAAGGGRVYAQGSLAQVFDARRGGSK